MEYVVSARKYRPLTFDAVVGQATLTTTLKNAIRSEKLAHAYLFCGPRGVGKTTCARIFARTINCSQPTADGEACGTCESCVAMTEQRSFNIFELDAASHNGVDDIRDLTEQTRIPPQVGKYKVFIIDEVHMLSTAAFNAFLKTLEEPPAHVIFILATTEKHKLLPTIISRCQIYDFERITVQSMIDHLHMVADKEGYTCDEEALTIIAEKADGAMRDALSIFDQVASYCQGNITYEKTIEDLNVLDTDNYFRLVDLSLEGNVTEILLLLDGVITKGFDPGNLCQGLASHIRNVMMAKEPKTTQILELSASHKARLVEQAKRCPTVFLYRALKILNNCEVNYRQSSNRRLLVELTLIQLAQLTQEDDNSPTHGRRPTQLKPIFDQKKAPEQPHAAPAPSPTHSPYGPTFADLHLSASEKDAPAKQKPPVDTPPPPVDTPPPPVEDVKTAPAATLSQERVEQEWRILCEKMADEVAMSDVAPGLKSLVPQLKTPSEVEIAVADSQLLEGLKKHKRRLTTALRKALAADSLSLTLSTPAAEEIKPKLTPAQQVEEMRKSNPNIELLFNSFDLELA